MATTISGTAGVTFPAGGLGNPAGAVVGTTDTQTLTNKTIQGGAITSGTAVASTSGTSIDFTSIPSWVKRISVDLQGVSLSGTAAICFRLGTVSGFETTGYVGVGQRSAASATAENNQTSTFVVNTSVATALVSGRAVFDLMNSATNLWTFTFTGTDSANSAIFVSAGNKPLAGVLTQVRLFSYNGTDTFDAGSINILYE